MLVKISDSDRAIMSNANANRNSKSTIHNDTRLGENVSSITATDEIIKRYKKRNLIIVLLDIYLLLTNFFLGKVNSLNSIKCC